VSIAGETLLRSASRNSSSTVGRRQSCVAGQRQGGADFAGLGVVDLVIAQRGLGPHQAGARVGDGAVAVVDEVGGRVAATAWRELLQQLLCSWWMLLGKVKRTESLTGRHGPHRTHEGVAVAAAAVVGEAVAEIDDPRVGRTRRDTACRSSTRRSSCRGIDSVSIAGSERVSSTRLSSSARVGRRQPSPSARRLSRLRELRRARRCRGWRSIRVHSALLLDRL
jgi:hypothetical protein